MAETEAAGLLRSGALYARRIGLRDADGRLVFAGLKRGAFSLYFDDDPIYHFDLEGRWQRAFVDGIHYVKALDNATNSIDRVREGADMVLRRHELPYAETVDLDASIRGMAVDLARRLANGEFTPVPPPGPVEPLTPDELSAILIRIAAWDTAAWFAHRERYLAAYGPKMVTMAPVPPNAIVLQATASGAFFRTPDEFSDHVRSVARLLGRRAVQAFTAFLADGWALRRPIADLVAYVDAIASAFPIEAAGSPRRPGDRPFDRPSLSGVEVVFDPASMGGPPPDRPGWEALAQRGVRRLSTLIGEADHASSVSPLIADARAAGLSASVWLPRRAEHAARLTEAVNALPLGAGDLVYYATDEEGGRRSKDAFGPALARGAKVIAVNPDKPWS